MKRRSFFGMLFTLPTSLYVAKSGSGWRHASSAPVEKWVWIIFAGGILGLGKLGEDGVWEQPERFVSHSVTHWMPLTKPQYPDESIGSLEC